MSHVDPVSTISAMIAILHRRSGHSTVSVHSFHGAGSDSEVRIEVEVAPATTFAELSALVTDGLGSDSWEASGYRVRIDAPAATGGEHPVVAVEHLPEHGVPALEVTVPAALQGELPAWRRQIDLAVAEGTEAPATRICDLPLLGTDELHTVQRFSGNGRVSTARGTVPEVFRQVAAARPFATAVTCADEVLTYADLDSLSDRIATRLLRATDSRSAVIGVLCPPSVRLVALLLGIVKAGHAYLALDSDEPPARIAEMLRIADVRLVLADDDLRSLLPPDGTISSLTVADVCADAGEQHDPADAMVTPDDLAYVSFTSGSTGVPKAVGVPHRGILRLLREPDWMTIDPLDTFVQLAPVAFDASTIEIWGPLLNGARLVVHPGRPLDLADLASTIVDSAVSVLLLTTGLFHRMVSEHLGAFERVRHVLTGGDVVSAVRVRELMNAWPGVRFTNGYGPTENTSYTTCWTSSEPPAGDVVPIGPAINGTQVRVLDAALRPVPPGIDGELYVTGDGLALGYVGAAGLTAERFVADPYATGPGGRMYRTGDVVRWSPDGLLLFAGRADRQLKIRGFRVEPAQIEECLLRTDSVRQAAVVPQPDGSGHARLIAYVVPAIQQQPGLEARLRKTLAQELPAYMVPWAFIVCDSLPLSRNGKVDRNSLPAALRSPRELLSTYCAPRSSVERELAGVWGEVLQVEPVGVHDNFFDLGGYSLMAADLLDRMKHQLGIEASAGVLYRNPTIAQLAAEVFAPY